MRKLTVLIFILISVNVYAGTPRSLQGIGITAAVIQNKNTGIYYYRYNICNPATNPIAEDGVLGTLEIDVSRTANDVQLPWTGLYFSNDTLPKGTPPHISITTQGILEQYRNQFTPIGIERVPQESEDSGLTTRWTVMFTFDKETNVMHPAYGESPEEPVLGLLPGKCLDSFILSSPALPSIRNAKALSRYMATEDDIPEGEGSNPSWIPQFYNNIAWHGKTIAPKAPPVHFMPVAFLNYIVSLKQQSYQLGWIVQKTEDEHDKDKSKVDKNNPPLSPFSKGGSKGDLSLEKGDQEKSETGIMQSLDTKLNHAKAALETGNTKQAINILSAFVDEVDGLYNVCREHEEHDGNRDRHDREIASSAKGGLAMTEGHKIVSLSKLDRNDKEYKREHCDKSHLTSEAYALLKYNTEYLIDRLGGKTRGHEKEDHEGSTGKANDKK